MGFKTVKQWAIGIWIAIVIIGGAIQGSGIAVILLVAFFIFILYIVFKTINEGRKERALMEVERVERENRISREKSIKRKKYLETHCRNTGCENEAIGFDYCYSCYIKWKNSPAYEEYLEWREQQGY